MTLLVHPSYFPNIAHFAALCHAESVVFEVWDHYQKQSYRNRMDILGPNGSLTLSVPVKYTQKNRQFSKDVSIAYETSWQEQHWRSIENAYRNAPFFMYYEDVIRPLYEQQYATLYEFVLRCFNAVISEMEVSFEVRQTTEYVNSDDQAFHDMRWLIHKKSQAQFNNTPYHQVFDTRFGFHPNLSILDLLFNLGPESLSYLKSQHLPQNANGK